jgi:hypothetical protein
VPEFAGVELMQQPLWGGRFPNLPLKPSFTKYKNLKCYGKLGKCKQYPISGMNYFENYSAEFMRYGEDFPQHYREIKQQATYRKVRAKLSSIDLSIGKIDKAPKNPDDIYYHLAKDYAWRNLQFALTKDINLENVDLVMKASAGIPFTWVGLKSKEKAISSELYDVLVKTPYQAIFATYDKVEFLEEEDLQRNKVRTMFGPDVIELILQKIFFDMQNEGIIDECNDKWIKYGVVKQYGGFHHLLKKIEKWPLRSEGDVSGYDRDIDLSDVYDLRLRGLNVPKSLLPKLFQVVENIIHSLILMPNGDVVEALTGNRSGTNNTASDNSIKHLIMKFYELITLRIDKGLPLPTYEEILEHAEIGIYSDDFIQSIDDIFFDVTPEEYQEHMIKSYAKFGLALKMKAVLVTRSSGRLDSKHSFLGSFASWDEHYNMYIPYPRLGKICSSILFDPLNEMERVDVFTRLLNLAVLSYPNREIFDIIVNYAKYIFATLSYKDKILAEEFLNSTRVDLDSRASFMSVVTGRECSFSWRLDGFKKLFDVPRVYDTRYRCNPLENRESLWV